MVKDDVNLCYKCLFTDNTVELAHVAQVKEMLDCKRHHMGPALLKQVHTVYFPELAVLKMFAYHQTVSIRHTHCLGEEDRDSAVLSL